VDQCESPIERLSLAAATERGLRLVSQSEIGRGRVDFAIPEPAVAVELDGHETHRSKQQREHDYQRQRALEKAGWKVVRFAGTEVYQYADLCATELLLVMDAAGLVQSRYDWTRED
jgi:very-short-patch-repair endonuclease